MGDIRRRDAKLPDRGFMLRLTRRNGERESEPTQLISPQVLLGKVDENELVVRVSSRKMPGQRREIVEFVEPPRHLDFPPRIDMAPIDPVEPRDVGPACREEFLQRLPFRSRRQFHLDPIIARMVHGAEGVTALCRGQRVRLGRDRGRDGGKDQPHGEEHGPDSERETYAS